MLSEPAACGACRSPSSNKTVKEFRGLGSRRDAEVSGGRFDLPEPRRKLLMSWQGACAIELLWRMAGRDPPTEGAGPVEVPLSDAPYSETFAQPRKDPPRT